MDIYEVLTYGGPRWGDYGTILFNGLARRVSGKVHLRRVGPRVPPLFLPAWVGKTGGVADGCTAIVSEEMMELLRTFDGVTFEKVILEKLVEMPWQKWKTSQPIPQEYMAESGEPEALIDEKEHSPSAASAVGQLYGMNTNWSIRIRYEQVGRPASEVKVVVSDSYSGGDILCNVFSKTLMYTTLRGMERIKRGLGGFNEWVMFCKLSAGRPNS
jgi:hypothetical protein